LSWQESCHVKEIDLGLERVSSVWKRLKTETSNSIYTITVAGTNGKGSSVALLESILLAEGYRVGVYSTPHLIKYNERIRLNGQVVAEDSITASFSLIDNARGATSLSYFEFGTLAALNIFGSRNVDIQILEVGLGGRLDAVNIINANAVLITSIHIDHVDWLGDDRSKIALEKAGVFRSHQKAVCSDETVPESLKEYAESLGTDLNTAGAYFNIEHHQVNWALQADHKFAGIYPYPALKGAHQVQNSAGVISLLAHIAADIQVDKKSIEEGLRKVSLAGRLQQISAAPDIYLDVAHNQESAIALARFIKELKREGKTHAVFSILSDKNAQQVIEPFIGLIDHWHIAPLSTTRTQDVNCLDALLSQELLQTCSRYSCIQTAFKQVKNTVKKQDLVICFGSFYVVEACLEAL
jgi:dihydrofolate synthase/folylpolyglutamate synthase